MTTKPSRHGSRRQRLLRTCAALGALTAAAALAPGARAASILTQTPQGTYASNVLGGFSWTTFTGMVTASHTITQTADFSSLAQLQSYDAVWVDQELGNTLGAAEQSALTSYVSAGNKIVLIGENASWTAWNNSLMAIVGGSYTGTCSGAIGTPLVSNTLTAGVGSVQNLCGSVAIDNVGDIEMLFSNNMAAVYTVGLGEALVILDSNWNDNSYMANQNNAVFAANVVTWLGEPLASGPSEVPEPGMLATFGLGLGLLGFARRQRARRA